MNVAVTARSAGRLTLNVFTDRLVSSTSQDVKPGTVKLPLSVGKDWGTGAYLVATLRRPLDQPAQRMPGRAIGVQWFSIDRAARTLAVDMQMPATIRPNTTLAVPVHVAGLNPGDEARVVVAAVDVGILNLTNYKPPAPDDYYLGQRRLTADIRDLYGELIDGMQGAAGKIRTGGDMGAELTGSPPTQAPLALYSGIVTVGANGVANVAFDIPAFAGTVRVMAVAWSKDKVGKATGDVVVRDPVVLTDDAAAVPAHRRPRQRPARTRQCRGRRGRLRDRADSRRHGQARQRQAGDADACRQAAQPRRGADQRRRRRIRHAARQCQRAERLCAGARLCARCAPGDANSHAPHRAHAGQGRDAGALQ